MSEAPPVVVEVGKSIEEAIEGLRWCHQHLQDRTVTLRLRKLEQTLGALALALDYEMEGQNLEVQVALEHASWGNRAAARTNRDLSAMNDHSSGRIQAGKEWSWDEDRNKA